MESPDSHLFQDTDETHAALMQATYDALCKHGYAGLTIQRIGDEFPKSKSLIYQHYDGKDELLVAFLGFMIDHFENDVEITIDTEKTALDQLQTHLDHLLDPTIDEERYEIMSAMTELRGQAPHNKAYREHFTKSSQIFHDHIADIIRMGIEQGEFREVDPERIAELLLTTIDGAIQRRTTTEDSVDIQAVRSELDEYIHSRLLFE